MALLNYFAVLCFFIFSWMFLIIANEQYEYDWTHSLYPPFTGKKQKEKVFIFIFVLYLADADGRSRYWDYKAFINSYSFIRLTPDEPSQSGYIFSKEEFVATDWYIEFQFQILSNEQNWNMGDGLAFWFTEKPYQAGKAFGHTEQFKGLGVFFDTFRNADHEVIIYFNKN